MWITIQHHSFIKEIKKVKYYIIYSHWLKSTI